MTGSTTSLPALAPLLTHRDALGTGWTRPALLGLVVCWALLGWRFGVDWALPAYGYLAAVGLVLARVDLRELRLPDVLTLPAYPLTVALLAVAAVFGSDSGSLSRAMLGGAAMWAVYLILKVIQPAGLGLGDVKLSGVIGMATGWAGWTVWTSALVAAFTLGATVSLGLLVLRRAHRKSALPFGPFMLAGAFMAVLASN